jgi:hypothetical protein
VEKNINRIMELITKSWEMSNSMVSFGTRSPDFHEYLQADFKNEKGFYICTVVTFGFKVTGMTELRTREENLPSPDQINQLNAC